MAQILTREEIYEMVWASPVTAVARQFSISDVALRKRCQKLDIPLPQAGYWSKLRAGKKVVRPKLPPRGAGMLAQVDFDVDLYGFRHRPISDAELLGPDPEPPTFDEPLEAIRERYLPKVGAVRVPRDLNIAHAAIKSALAADELLRAGITRRTSVSIFDKLRFDSVFEKRRLRVLNALALTLVRAGAKVDLRGKKLREITVRINDISLHLALESAGELAKGHDDFPTREIAADSPLTLAIIESFHNRKMGRIWRDTEAAKLEAQLAEVAVELFVQAEADYRANCEWHHQWRIQRKAERIEEIRRAKEKAERKERERLEQLKQARIDRLLDEAEALRQAQAIRAYIVSARTAAPASLNGSAVEQWAQWALMIADTIDPVTNKTFVTAIRELQSDPDLAPEAEEDEEYDDDE